MKIKISRAFEMKKQIKQYEPASWFCGIEAEMEIPNPGKMDKDGLAKIITDMSERMAKVCQNEVEKSEQLYMAPPEKVEKFDEFAPANIKEEPFWVKKDLKKVNAFKNPDIAENAKADAELSTEAELEEEI